MMIKPMLCRTSLVPIANDPDYIWEIKYDGARIIAFVDGSYRLQARSGSDKTATFPELRIETRQPAVLDCEVVSARGLSFQDSVQKRINRVHNISSTAASIPVKLMVLDCLNINFKSIETLLLESRKELLSNLVTPTDNVEVAPYTEDALGLWNNTIIPGNLEGMVGKLKNGMYFRGYRGWRKVKAWKRNYGKNSTGEVFMVVGYTRGTGWRESTFGALELARVDIDYWTYVGEVGTGFDVEDLAYICTLFSPASCLWSKEPESAIWIKPFAVKIQYLEYTNDGQMRFPSYKGIDE